MVKDPEERFADQRYHALSPVRAIAHAAEVHHQRAPDLQVADGTTPRNDPWARSESRAPERLANRQASHGAEHR
jgi:hypothetical protein